MARDDTALGKLLAAMVAVCVAGLGLQLAGVAAGDFRLVTLATLGTAAVEVALGLAVVALSYAKGRGDR